MTAYPSWTPAPRPGIIPLQPLTFGTILGRSFSALRHNPKVLLGFAMVVQTVAYLVVTIAISGIAFASFSRLDTVPAGTDEWDAVLTGSITLTALSGLVLGLLAGAVGVLVQAVVISDVLHAAVAEKMTLRMLWQRVRPVAWRLIGYTILLSLAIGVIVIIVGGLIAVLAVAVPAAAVILGILVILAAIPLSLWLAVKLLLVPAVLIVEHTSLGAALGRSWRLSRGRFWVILGIMVLVSLVFGAVAQVVSIPFSFLASALTTVIAPTGEMEHHISSLTLLYTIQVAVMWGDRSCQFVHLLNDIVDAHHQLFIRLYPRCCKPKMHYRRHLPDLMAQFMKVITCFSAERRHRMSKRIAAYSHNQLHLTMLRGCIARTHRLLQHPAAFECVVLGKVLGRKKRTPQSL